MGSGHVQLLKDPHTCPLVPQPWQVYSLVNILPLRPHLVLAAGGERAASCTSLVEKLREHRADDGLGTGKAEAGTLQSADCLLRARHRAMHPLSVPISSSREVVHGLLHSTGDTEGLSSATCPGQTQEEGDTGF